MPFNQTLVIPNVQGDSTALSNTTPPAIVANLAVSGVIGTAPLTVDVNTVFTITQTTANITITLPNPTVVTGARIYTMKSSTASTNPFQFYGKTVYPGKTIIVLWDGTAYTAINDPIENDRIESVATATYTTTQWGNVILVNATASAVAVTLATNVGNTSKETIVVKTAGTNNVTVVSTGLIGTNNTLSTVWQAIVYKAVSNTQTIAISGGSTGQTIQQLNATGNITSWNSIVEIGATPLVANITITLPTVVGALGNNITIKRLDSTAFTVTIAPFAGQTVEITTPTVLNSQFGALTVTSVSATASEQTANIGMAPVLWEYGIVQVNNQIFTTNTFVDSTNGIFTIPSAGTWRLRYDLSTDSTSIATIANSMFTITDSANVIVNGTEKARWGSTSVWQVITAEAIVTTTGAANYKLRGRIGSLAADTVTILNNASYDSTLSWEKISGFSPVTGQSVDYRTVSTWNVSGIVASTDAIFSTVGAGNIPYSAGLFTLTAGKTYEIKAHLEGTLAGNTSSDWVQFLICDSANTVIPNSPTGVILGTANSSNWQNSADLSVIFTPTVTTQIKLRLNNRGSTASFSTNGGLQGGSGCWMTVTQLGSSSAIATPITDQTGTTTSGYFDIGTMRMQWGIATTTPALTVVNMPAVFLNTNYSLQLTPRGTSSFIEAGQYQINSASQFAFNGFYNTAWSTAYNSGRVYSWLAIWPKP